jgi:hypothetical protein
MVEKQKDERVKQNALKFLASQLNLVRESLGQGQRQRTKHTLHIEWNIKINKSGDEIHTQIHTESPERQRTCTTKGDTTDTQ